MEARGLHVFFPRFLAGAAHFANERRWPVKVTGQAAPRRKNIRRENLIAALDAIGAPLFIVGTNGEVLHTNSNGRSLSDRDRSGLEESLARTVAGAANDRGWQLIPLSGAKGPSEFLAILRSAAQEPAGAAQSPSPQAARARWRLTARQAEVLDLVARGLTNVNIAATLGIAEGTVEYHLASIFGKARVQNRASLIARLHEI